MKHVTSKKEMDKLVVEAVVHRFGPVSRVQIHELTHLQRIVISHRVRELLEERRLVEAGSVNNPKGWKQILLRINENWRFVLGVEFDNERVTAAAMNLSPKIIARVEEPA